MRVTDKLAHSVIPLAGETQELRDKPASLLATESRAGALAPSVGRAGNVRRPGSHGETESDIRAELASVQRGVEQAEFDGAGVAALEAKVMQV